ncbi:MAG: Npt1/Npt2 family nucleotide transporter [bacterium]|nr:Npt1/Npt2 family nucleotide transporter [bacterium]
MFKRLFGSIIDVRKGEIRLALLMFLYIYLLLVTYYFLRPARDSLFLVELGPQQLPIVFMLIAAVVVPVMTLYSRASRSLKLNQLINVTTLILISNLAILRWMLGYSHPAVFYTFYIWVSIYGVMATAQFWLLANGIFDATQAKRLFVLFGLGGIIGAFTGGEVTSFVVERFDVSTENLLFFCMAFLGICVVLVNTVWRLSQSSETVTPPRSRAKQKKEEKESSAETFKMIKRSRHLMLIVGMIAITVAVGSFVDFQFKFISSEAFPEKKDLTSFLGKFYGRLSLISFLFQLLISYRFLRRFGVGGAISLLPFGLLAGTVTMLLLPGLLAGVLLQGTAGVIRYSIHKTGRELLFLPVPLDVKKRTKVFIDIFIDRWFRGIAGGVLLLCVTVLHMSVRQLSFVVFAMILAWLVVVWMMRKEYVNAFRKALERREIDLSDLRIGIEESSTLATLKAALDSTSERQITYALEMLKGVQDATVMGAVRPLLLHDSPSIRRSAVAALMSRHDDTLVAEMRKLMTDEDAIVRRDALYYVCEHSGSDRIEFLEKYLQDDDPAVRVAAIGVIAHYGGPAEHRILTADIVSKVIEERGETGEIGRIDVAKALDAIVNPELKKYLLRLMDDPSPDVVHQALLSAGRSSDREFIPPLLERLKNPRHRKFARDALAGFGDRIVGTLSDYIIDPATNTTVRSSLCRVLGQIPTQHSADALIGTLDIVEYEMRYYVVKALNSLRVRHPELKFSHRSLNDALIDETESYYAILQILNLEGPSDGDADKLFLRALREKIDENLDRMFRLLALSYSPKDIHGAYLGITSDHKHLRANAIEFLDNVLRKEVKKYLFPIVDSLPDDFRMQKGNELFGLNITNSTSAMKFILEGKDAWLKACALYTIKDETLSELRELVEKATRDPHPVVQETAQLALAR